MNGYGLREWLVVAVDPETGEVLVPCAAFMSRVGAEAARSVAAARLRAEHPELVDRMVYEVRREGDDAPL